MTTLLSTELRKHLVALRPSTVENFPRQQLQYCAQEGLFAHQRSRVEGGLGFDTVQKRQMFMELGQSCLTTGFVLSQFWGALDRLQRYAPERKALLDKLYRGEQFVTLGISQLSTSHQHKDPPLTARVTHENVQLKGFAPWVTGAAWADFVLLGACQDDGANALFLVAKEHVHCLPPQRLAALNGSHTAAVSIDAVLPLTSRIYVESGVKITSPGSPTSIALALGLAYQAYAVFCEESGQRPSLQALLGTLEERLRLCKERLFMVEDLVTLRFQVNRLLQDLAQLALLATKGSGYRAEHLASRLCNQALFFLVWSCPQQVVDKHIRKLASAK